MRLNRKPLHSQIADRLREDIAANFEVGKKLPSESELADKFSVSSMTIREALSALAQEGVLERRHGSGTYMANKFGNRHVAILSEMDLGNANTPYFNLRITNGIQNLLSAAGIPARLYVGHTKPGAPSPMKSTSEEFLEALKKS